LQPGGFVLIAWTSRANPLPCFSSGELQDEKGQKCHNKNERGELMRKQHLSPSDFKRMIEDDVAGDYLARLGKHLRQCVKCRKRLKASAKECEWLLQKLAKAKRGL
jgi:hypothetical protein